VRERVAAAEPRSRAEDGSIRSAFGSECRAECALQNLRARQRGGAAAAQDWPLKGGVGEEEKKGRSGSPKSFELLSPDPSVVLVGHHAEGSKTVRSSTWSVSVTG
jgi:hypothetical protein